MLQRRQCRGAAVVLPRVLHLLVLRAAVLLLLLVVVLVLVLLLGRSVRVVLAPRRQLLRRIAVRWRQRAGGQRAASAIAASIANPAATVVLGGTVVAVQGHHAHRLRKGGGGGAGTGVGAAAVGCRRPDCMGQCGTVGGRQSAGMRL